MSELPRSLQSMIEEAKRANETTCLEDEAQVCFDDSECDEFSQQMNQALDQFLSELSRGIYSQELYLSCVADDCEEDGDWEGAKSACREIIRLEEAAPWEIQRAHSRLGSIHFLLGEDESALKEYQLASSNARDDDSQVLLSNSTMQESWQLLLMGRCERAAALARDRLSVESNPDDEMVFDELGVASLNLILAACKIAMKRMLQAQEFLQVSRLHLENVSSALADCDALEEAAGIHACYCGWHRVQAEYSRHEDDVPGQVKALQMALGKARHIACLEHVAGPHWDALVMRVHLSLADTLREVDREESAEHRAQALQIQKKCKLPDSAVRWRIIP